MNDVHKIPDDNFLTFNKLSDIQYGDAARQGCVSLFVNNILQGEITVHKFNDISYIWMRNTKVFLQDIKRRDS